MNRFLFLLIGVFMVGSVLALGVTPARTVVDFEGGLKKTINFDVLNLGDRDIRVLFSAQGELSGYMTLPIKESEILSSEKVKSFSYELNLPSELSPGLHIGEVLVMKLPEDSETAGSHILSTLAVVTQIHLYVPYPGKYANAKMYVYGADVGEEVRFVIPVVSAGEFDLTEVRANVDIYNKMGEKVESFNTNSIEVASGAKKELVYEWRADVEVGEYRARAAVIYDEGTINLEEVFNVGSKELVLQDIEVVSFNLGEIAKLEMLVENMWSEDILNAHIKTEIMDSSGNVVSSFESAARDVDALSKENFVTYWDTAGVREGEYDAEVSISYAGKVSKEKLKFQVSENELIIVGLGYVISAEKEGMSGVVIVLIVAVVVLVLINLLWFLLLRKRLKGKR